MVGFKVGLSKKSNFGVDYVSVVGLDEKDFMPLSVIGLMV